MKESMPRRGPESQRLLQLHNQTAALLYRSPYDTQVISRQDMQILVHELQAYHIELEAQNEELRRLQEELEVSRNRYSELYNSAPVGYLTLNLNGDILEANQTAAHMLGVGKGALVGSKFAPFIARGEREALHLYMNDVLETRMRQSRDFRMLRRDGSQFFARFESMVCSEKGKPAQWRMTFSDVTAHRGLEAQLRETQKREALGAFTENLAHHFDNILTSMLGFTELALFDLPHNNPIDAHLREVLTAGRRAAELVKQMYTYSNKALTERRLISISTLLHDALGLLQASLPPTIQLRRELPEDAGILLADPAKMHQLVLYLFDNAVYAMRETGGVLEVHVEALEVDADFARHHLQREPGPYVRVMIRDTGEGMAPEVAARVFDPFFTTKGTAVGMGLSMAHGIVTSHGGAIWLHSLPGAGTTVTMYLPTHTSEVDLM